MSREYRNRVLASVHETAEGLASAGVMSKETMREIEELCQTPARKALLSYAEAWTYPIIGNEDLRVVKRLFSEARELAKDASAGAADPPEFAQWLEILRDESCKGSNEWEDALHAVTDYFGLSTEK